MTNVRVMARKWLLFWGVFYGVGAPLFQVLFILQNGFLNQFSLVDFVAGLTMLVSVWGLWQQRPWARLLNAVAWGAYFAVFAGAMSYFVLFLKEETPRAAAVTTGVGLPVALSCILIHLRTQSLRRLNFPK